MTILEVEKLKVLYSNHVAIENINFKIEDGEYVCLVGENGSGKSTLVKTIVTQQSNVADRYAMIESLKLAEPFCAYVEDIEQAKERGDFDD